MGVQNEPGKIFVGGLSWDTDNDSLQGYFSQFGEISDCIIMTNPDTGKSRGFGFISFKDPDTVDIILSTTNHAVDGRKVDAKACTLKGATAAKGKTAYRTNKIFVGGLPNIVNEETIRECFSRFGKVTEVVIMVDQEKKRSRGFGFLTFDNEDSVEQACAEHFVNVSGKQVECKKAERRTAAARTNASTGQVGGYGGNQQGWGQGNWGDPTGWIPSYSQPGWCGPGGWSQGTFNANGWVQGMHPGAQAMIPHMSGHGMGHAMGMQGMVASPQAMGTGAHGMSVSAHGMGVSSQGQNMPAGYNGYGQGAQQNMSYGGGYGAAHLAMSHGAGQNAYGQQGGGYSGQMGGGHGGMGGATVGMGGAYQQRQAPGNAVASVGRAGVSQNYHPYGR